MKDKNENKDNEIQAATIDGGVVTLSASGLKYKTESNEVETTEYAWQVNRAGLYNRLSDRINKKLNQAIQELEYGSLADPLVLYFSCSTIAKHFYSQLKSHGWNVTMCPDDDVVQIDIPKSVDQLNKGKE